MSAATDPFVSVILPCRNEEWYIEACLDSVLTSDYPRERMEILVVDGESDDGTRERVARYALRHPCVRLLENPRRITPAGLNVGLREARGEVIVRLDAHVVYPATYIPQLVRGLAAFSADNVGGVIVTLPAADTPRARAIALGLSHPFGVGNSYFRIGSSAQREVDTVPFGCYRREVFERIGVFDEELVRNQDDEFNFRLIRNGGRILLLPEVRSFYYARDSLRKVARMYYQYGYFKPLVARKVGRVMTVRQLVPAVLVLAMASTGALALGVPMARAAFALVALSYAAAALGCALHAARRDGIRTALLLAVVFALLHLGYGAGFLAGSYRSLLHPGRQTRDAALIPLSR